MAGATCPRYPRPSSTEHCYHCSSVQGRRRYPGSPFKQASIKVNHSSCSKGPLKLQPVRGSLTFLCAVLRVECGSCAPGRQLLGQRACPHASFNWPRRANTVQGTISDESVESLRLLIHQHDISAFVLKKSFRYASIGLLLSSMESTFPASGLTSVHYPIQAFPTSDA